MKRTLVITCVSLFCLATGISSCKKGDKDTPAKAKTTQELLIGNWDINHEAHDDNNNGILEDNEIYIRTGDQQWVFEDGLAAMTYYIGGAPNQLSYSYTLSGMEMSMTMNGDQTPSKHITITELTDTDLKWKDGDMWRMYTRK